jgi:hypothetical protein
MDLQGAEFPLSGFIVSAMQGGPYGFFTNFSGLPQVSFVSLDLYGEGRVPQITFMAAPED